MSENLIIFGGSKLNRPKRNKGASLLTIPNEYIMIDIESTGLDSYFDSIIEVAAIHYKDSIEIDKFVELMKPDNYDILDKDNLEDEIDYLIKDGEYIQYVPKFITNLTGITNQMLENARNSKDVLNDFYNFIGSNILVGYNVNFDINFLYDNLLEQNIELKNDYVDVMRIARRFKPDLKHHRQQDLAALYNLDNSGAHRAEFDCRICNIIFNNLLNEINNIYENFDNFIKEYNKSHSGWTVKDITTTKTNFDESHPLFGKSICFTGILEKMTRKEALQLVADFGGIPMDSVNKTTNFLILGNNDYCTQIKDGKSNKQKKAEKLILEGIDIQILSENVFYDLIEQN